MTTSETYNEVMYAAGSSPKSHGYNFIDPLFRYDTRFPDRITTHAHEENLISPERRSGGSSRRRMRNRSSARFKTQPITFDEIQEVDEDATPEDPIAALKDQFTAFSKSMDGLMSSKRDGCSSSDDGCSIDGGILPVPNAAHLAQHERSRSRRLKRRVKKGIAEVPEPEMEAADSQAG